jgi:hypothetical protein
LILATTPSVCSLIVLSAARMKTRSIIKKTRFANIFYTDDGQNASCKGCIDGVNGFSNHLKRHLDDEADNNSSSIPSMTQGESQQPAVAWHRALRSSRWRPFVCRMFWILLEPTLVFERREHELRPQKSETQKTASQPNQVQLLSLSAILTEDQILNVSDENIGETLTLGRKKNARPKQRAHLDWRINHRFCGLRHCKT